MKSKEIKIIDVNYYIIPFLGNRHNNPYGLMTIRGKSGKIIKIYYEIGKPTKGGYLVENNGSLNSPILTITALKGE